MFFTLVLFLVESLDFCVLSGLMFFTLVLFLAESLALLCFKWVYVLHTGSIPSGVTGTFVF